MNTWSYTIGVTTFPLKPQECSIVFADLPEADRHVWNSDGFFRQSKRTPSNPKTTWTLEEFMLTDYDAHNLLNNMTDDMIRAWLHLIHYLAMKYPELDEMAFHFFCINQQIPYYFIWKRRKDGVNPRCMRMGVGNSESVYYFQKTEDTEGQPCLIFEESAYLENWKRATFGKSRLGPNEL